MFNVQYKPLTSAPKTPLKFIFAACKGYYHFFIFEIVYAFCNSLFKVSVAVVFSAMIGYFSSITVADFSWNKALFYLGGILALFLGTNLIRFVRDYINENVRNTISWRVREYGITYAAGHSAAYLKEQKSGQLAQRIISLSHATWGQLFSFTRLNSCTWLILITLFYIGRVSIWFLIPIIIFGVCSILVSIAISKKTTALNKQGAAANAQFSGEVIDSLTNILLIKLFGQERREIDKLQKDINRANSINIQAVKSESSLYAIQEILLMTFRICGIFMAIYLWQLNKIDVAGVVLVLLLLDDILTYFSRFFWEITNIRTSLGKLADALTFLQIPHDIVDVPQAPALVVKKGKIEFKNLVFGYTPHKKVFNGFNLTIQPGEKIGVVGKSGSGKSTLINLLQRSYDLQKGAILIDGQDISQVSTHSLKQALSIIAQDSLLFHRTIKKNIAFGSPDASDRQIYYAARKALADDFIKQTPHGYLTITGERGVKLSGGQRQRIAIARALLKKSPILILDEATSALDNETENEVIEAINELMCNKTVIAIAHRLSTLKEMDRIIVLDKGKIIEEGTPASLLDKQGKFAKLWNLQQE